MKTKVTTSKVYFLWAILLPVISCGVKTETQKIVSETGLALNFHKYELENGLNVVLHQDKSDPIVAVAVHYGVGSNREKIGQTGFAHLFEHLLFERSENVPQGGFSEKIYGVGGNLNGSTYPDKTIYYETVPKNALELVLWLESDRMGYFIKTVTETAFAKQKNIVKNEKRQRVDNIPYGHSGEVIAKNLYPKGHPYSWRVIGNLEDIQNATVEDAKEFYDRFYGPNNTTLVIAGDFEIEESKELIEKYFGEINKRQEVEPLPVQKITLSKIKRLYHEDNFAKAPRLVMAWPSVEIYNKDAYALDYLGKMLSSGKNSPFHKILVQEKKLTAQPSAQNYSKQLAGEFYITVTANSGTDLDSIEAGIYQAFDLFEKEGVTDNDVERVKTGLEMNFYEEINNVMDKAILLAEYDVFTGNPGFLVKDIDNIRSVTKEDVMRVYEKYIKNKPFVMSSFVPKGQLNLIAENSIKAEIIEEDYKEDVQPEIVEAEKQKFEITSAKFDRSIPPEVGESPKLILPEIWKAELENQLKVYGIEQKELPIVNFSFVIEGGHLLDDLDKSGTASLLAVLLKEGGTAKKTPAIIEEELAVLGSTFEIRVNNESIIVRGSSLKRNWRKTMQLFQEILLQPSWDEKEFLRFKESAINRIKRSEAYPTAIADQIFNKVLYGKNHPFSNPVSGTVESIERISLADLKNYYNKFFSPVVSSFHVVGDVSKPESLKALESFVLNWEAKEVVIPDFEITNSRDKATLFFVDVPNSKQSVINIGSIGIPYGHEDFFLAEVMNANLGGPSGRLGKILREEKGYTYGAYSGFGGLKYGGYFMAASSVQSNATGESVTIFRDEITKYKNGITKKELESTKKAKASIYLRQYEKQENLLYMLEEISLHDLNLKFIENKIKVLNAFTLEQHQKLANKYLDESKMVYIVVGDAATQLKQFEEMGFDEVILVDKKGKEINP